MPDINFLDNKKQEEDRKLKNIQEENIAWSEPEKQEIPSKKSAFSFLPFFGLKEGEIRQPAEKSKIKKSRKEILSLIKRHENSKPVQEKKRQNIFSGLAEKFKKQPARNDALIDYQKVFNSEKENKDKAGAILKEIKEIKPESKFLKASFAGRLNKLSEFLKRKLADLSGKKKQRAETIKSNPENNPEAVSPVIAEEKNDKILKTNLIQGEIVTFFDWRSKIIVSAIAVLAPIFIIAASYFGLAFYQKNSRLKNSEQARIFSDLEKKIAEEESGMDEILDFQKKLAIISQVFDKHIYWTNFFKFLEDNTIKNVYFTSFDGDTSGNYAMEALASDYGSISEQTGVFKNNKKITSVEAGGGETISGDDKNKSMVRFDLKFSILNGIFTE